MVNLNNSGGRHLKSGGRLSKEEAPGVEFFSLGSQPVQPTARKISTIPCAALCNNPNFLCGLKLQKATNDEVYYGTSIISLHW
jgi:hypothetical protein